MRGAEITRKGTVKPTDRRVLIIRLLAKRAAVRLTTAALCALTLSAPAYGQPDLNEAARAVYQRETQAASQRGDLISSGADYDRIQLITKRLIAVAPEMRADASSGSWEVSYIRASAVNANCLPGGKMMVFSGLVDRLALTDDELAAVVGHEMGHALLEHGRESYNQRQVAKVFVGVLGIVAALAGAKHHTDPNVAFNASTTVGALGAEFLALRPYSRERELAADKYGAELSARAGFDVRGAITLQQKLATQGSGIEFLSTHPASATRVQELAQFVPGTAERFASRRGGGGTLAKVPDAPVYVAAAAAGPEVPAALSTNANEAVRAVLSAYQSSALLSSGSESARKAPPDPDAVTGAAAAAMPSKHMFSAERYAKAHGCAIPAATMVARASTYEAFEMSCSGGSRLVVRCEPGCATLE